MKKLTLSDGTIVETEIGWADNHWEMAPNVQEVEFEDGTVLENPDYDEDWTPDENN